MPANPTSPRQGEPDPMQPPQRGGLLTWIVAGAVSLGLLGFIMAQLNELAPPIPNIVLIHVDDLGYNDLSFNGATEIATPHIDRLADEGVIFSNGYAAADRCSPSRAGLMTGRYPARFGMGANLAYAPADPAHGLPTEETTLATHLRNAGYRTGVIGKWDLGAAPPFHPLNRGFDTFFGFLAGEHDYFRIDITASPSLFHLLPINENRDTSGFTGYLTDALTERAVEFIRKEQQAPFFLYLAYNAPHTPLQAPPELLEKYAHIGNEKRRRYLAMVDSLDRGVGRVLDALRETGQRDDTLVFFLSDNGGVYSSSPRSPGSSLHYADNSPFRGGKGSYFEGGIRVPFVASWPARWPQGATFEPMVISLDIAATALAAAGVSADGARPLDGVNLGPFVRGETAGPVHEALFWRRELPTWAVRAGDAKLFKDPIAADAALFDLRSDPGETRDRSGGNPNMVARLTALWNDWNLENQKVPDHLSWRRAEAWKNHARPNLQPDVRDAAPSCSNGVVVSEPDRNPGLVADCAVLVEVADTLAGNGRLNWPRFGRPLQRWDGVGVGGSPKRVRELKLSSGLTGSIPSKLGELDGLEVLNLGRNRLTGGLPPELGNLSRLRTLALAHNDLSGALPPELGRLSSLEQLWLKANRLTGAVPPEWGELSRLRFLRLAGNSLLSCIPPALQEVENHDLEALGLPSCRR